MAIGDLTDCFNRLKQNLAPWFGNAGTPILDALLKGAATVTAFNYTQFSYILLQTRLQTATENNLDLISLDYFKGEFPRNVGESDDSYRARLLALLLLQRGTKKGLHDAILIMTGNEPILFEPWDGTASGYFNVPSTLAFNIAGCYGSDGSGVAYTGWIDVFVNPSPPLTDLDIILLVFNFKAFGTFIHLRIHRGNIITFYDV